MSDQLFSARILFVDDEASILKSLRRVTRAMHAECEFVDSAAKALSLLESSTFDVIVSDMQMPEMNGAALLAEVARHYPETMRLVLSGYSDDELIMAAINEGRIWGFVHKPWDDNQLLVTLKQAIEAQQMMVERALLRHTLKRFTRDHKNGFCSFIGASAAMQAVYGQIERAAPSNASVFVTGPSGTGKELAAEAIHTLSTRKDKPFIALNCAAIPSELMESEVFGHVKGAFSGAVSNREGAAGQASGGTLFLDELGEMDIGLQAKLLRFIQTGTYQKVGASKLESADIRFVCATNRNPQKAIEDGALREDLYYRLNVVAIDLPALCERQGDAMLLANHFLLGFAEQEQKELVGFSSEASALIANYAWPGNVRQLQNSVHSMVVMSAGPLITKDDLSSALQLSPADLSELAVARSGGAASSEDSAMDSVTDSSALPATAVLHDTIRPLVDIEREYIELAIQHCQGNVVRAASLLQVSPSTLYRKIQSWQAPAFSK
ncbi:DNA-binding transcriptional response regulator, NtrC family, contains REC, AAA-type ATPase, and a Fis-type DNA-binding domains [Alteromonadaceae bacterium Bs31]|nr:DNA-binding transcriptional response regulator, NtrC family, contains REC, AAA-type ATPase, and a Fis-type DNA-binding domains [Alteromonadaceae bacterium Bs31]